jgi:hypothetical protein
MRFVLFLHYITTISLINFNRVVFLTGVTVSLLWIRDWTCISLASLTAVFTKSCLEANRTLFFNNVIIHFTAKLFNVNFYARKQCLGLCVHWNISTRNFPQIIRGSFQKFFTPYVFSLKINLFYKIHLQAFNTYNLHCALSLRSNVWESLVFLSGRLRCWCVWLLRPPRKTPPQCFWSVSHGVVSSILGTSRSLVGWAQWILHWRPVNVFCKINSFLKRKHTVCRTFGMTHVKFVPPPLKKIIFHKL